MQPKVTADAANVAAALIRAIWIREVIAREIESIERYAPGIVSPAILARAVSGFRHVSVKLAEELATLINGTDLHRLVGKYEPADADADGAQARHERLLFRLRAEQRRPPPRPPG